MCNRYKPPEEAEIEREYEIGRKRPLRWWDDLVHPLKTGPYIKAGGELECGQWGMIPPYSKTRHPADRQGRPLQTNNCRRERLATAETFRAAWRAGQRCIIPASYWVEPYYGYNDRCTWWAIWRHDGRPAGLAGIWSEWTDPSTGEIVPSYSMVTQNCAGHPLLSRMHRKDKPESRSVVLLEHADYDAWLHGSHDQAEALIRLPPVELLGNGPEDPNSSYPPIVAA